MGVVEYGPALERLAARGVVSRFACLELPGNVPPWTKTGLDVAPGEVVTLLASGRVVTSAELQMSAGAKFHLWRRVAGSGGTGPVRKGTQDTTSFVADAAGALELAICQGEWGTPEGELATPVEAYAVTQGELDVAAIVWSAPSLAEARAGLESLASLLPGGGLARAEIERLDRPVPRPEGWKYLWFLGDSDTFSRRPGESAIAAHTRDDAAILRREIELDVRPDTRLEWRWRIDALPSERPEDALLSHDYLSIAVEFDCGRDLTYLWSHSLPEGHVFTCPIPVWAPRETHFVIRSGPDGLGDWVREERPLQADYRRALDAEPRRIVAVWLIAVSLFQHGEGRAAFDEIALLDGERRIPVI
jgi:hypothetical protein